METEIIGIQGNSGDEVTLKSSIPSQSPPNRRRKSKLFGYDSDEKDREILNLRISERREMEKYKLKLDLERLEMDKWK